MQINGFSGYGMNAYSAYNSIQRGNQEQFLSPAQKQLEDAKKPQAIKDLEERQKPDYEKDKDDAHKIGRKSSPQDCETCKHRKYQDGSDENVSFKSAQHVSPGGAAAAVRAHEGEHVANAYTKAKENGGEVLSASVTIHQAVCPECGRVYVSGGETNTTIKYPNESNPYQQARKSQDATDMIGQRINYSA